MKRIKAALQDMANSLQPYDDAAAKYVLKAIKLSPEEIANDLSFWGGSGSLVDQAIEGERGSARRNFELSAIELGNALLEAGARNPRMEHWIDVFQKWKAENV